ncbi:hypothetical protein [Agrobacterium tumefaciens]|uniref:hypothetical protein n=1 Tax=Agrobacterium tumefaciens TaxID=358 RepID=UPI001AE8F75E|nr:hypothetical protein [Agrobacterium tumefaciens]MBP2532568.1 hypothetical protein [Agrobacterium tumefaciens]
MRRERAELWANILHNIYSGEVALKTGNGTEFEPQHELIDPFNDLNFESPTFHACTDAHGKYETLRFTLRLSPINHSYMEKIETGAYSGPPPPEALQAYSTYLHETVHWWQHVGSTSGMLLSLSYLGQCHANIEDLKEVIAKIGPKKSLKRYADNVLLTEGQAAQQKLAAANNAVNNALDIEYYKLYALDPRKNAKKLVEQKHFEAVGYQYFIAYGQLIGMISAALDPDFKQIPNMTSWDTEILRLISEKAEGFYHGSNIRLPATGMRAIYEGQARFTQLQFLDAMLSPRFTVAEWRSKGFMADVYGEAFDCFLRLLGIDEPTHLDDPAVALFLLVCDLSINPTRGFPFDVETFEDFIVDVDVGVRFTNLCFAAKKLPHLHSAIVDYSKEEYASVADELTQAVGYDHPLAALKEINKFATVLEEGRKMIEDQRTFAYPAENLTVRFLVSHFLAFSQDRYLHPEFFCWPGIWKSRAGLGDRATTLWLKHLAPFGDRGDKEGVYPRKWPNRDDSIIMKTFHDFFGTMAIYDLTRQWILYDGPFVKDFRWLMENYDQEQVDKWANDSFSKVYGVNLSDFELVV